MPIPPTRSYPKKDRANLIATIIVGGFAVFVVGVTAGWAIHGPRSAASATPDPNAGPKVNAPEAPPRRPSSTLAGVWTSRGSGRPMKLVVFDDRLELRVQDAGRWEMSYGEDELRAVLRATSDPDRFEVEDLYRPWAPRAGYSEAGKKACTVKTTEYAGKKLTATVIDHDAIEVQMAMVTMNVLPDASDQIVGCEAPKVTGITTVQLRRRKAVPQ
jgi:hypothetical protein